MATPDYKLCDVCGSQTKLDCVYFWVDRNMGGAGSMENEFEGFDLCGKHMQLLLQKTFDKKNFDENKKAVELIKTWQRNNKKGV